MKFFNKRASRFLPQRLRVAVQATPAIRCAIPEPVAIVDCPSTYVSEPRVATLFANNTIRVSDAKTLELVEPVIDLRAEASVGAICMKDASTIVTGGADGCLIVSNTKSMHEPVKIKAHDNAVVGIDSADDYIISLDSSNGLTLSSFDSGNVLTIELRASLEYMPVAVKFIRSREGKLNVLVVCPRGIRFELLAIDNLESRTPLTTEISIQGEIMSKTGCRIVDVVLDETRTRYSATVDCMSDLWIMIGDLLYASFFNVIITATDPHSSSKLAWRRVRSLWLTDSDGVVCGVKVADGRIVSKIVDQNDAVVCMQVRYMDGIEVLIEDDGEKILLWK